MLELAWLIPALPLAGFLALLVAGRRIGEPGAGWAATLATAGSFAATVVVFAGLLGEAAEERTFTQTLFTWVPAGGFSVDVAFLVDPLSMAMCLFVTGVATLIHLYSVGYMAGDANFSKFFVYLNLFVFSMLVLVLGDNLLLTFLGWEGVGACSYFLVSFWFTSERNASAGKKAFVTNRIGDWGFMVAMFLCFFTLGSLDYLDIASGAAGLAAVTATGIAGFLFIGAIGKSAQIPLFVWLPDAMAGPTPVSALIHAATMVTAGVYLMTRVSPLLDASSPWLMTAIAVIGALTALFAAAAAVAQTDIKRVLAYSTISQLGYMFLAVGSGLYIAAIFHMITHAFFKALLFLGSGSVIHGMDDEQDMRRMGALAKVMPVTAGTFIVGWLAIAGVPPFSGFWSKDEILLAAWNEGGVVGPLLWAVGLVTAVLTAYYMARQVFLTFYGPARWDRPLAEAVPELAADRDEAGITPETHGVGPTGEIHPHESSWLMTLPLVALAALALVGGVINLPITADTEFLAIWLEPVVEAAEAPVTVATGTKWVLAILATLAALGGIAAAIVTYLRRAYDKRPADPEVLAHALYVDDGVSELAGGPGRRVFDGVAFLDRTIVDGAVNGVATLVRSGGTVIRHLQTGFVRNYAVGIAVGAVVVDGLFMVRGGVS